MRNYKQSALIAIALLALAPRCFCQTAIVGSRDLARISAPGAPPAGYLRIYAEDSTGQLACKDSSGTNCIPSGASTAFNPLDEDIFWIRDDFFKGGTGWAPSAFGGATSNSDFTSNEGDGNRWGIYRLVFGSTPASGWGLAYRPTDVGGTYVVHDLMDATDWEFRCVMKGIGATESKYRCGMFGNRNADAQVQSVYIGAASTGTAGYWSLTTCDASTCTSAATSAQIATQTWYKLRVWCSAGSGGRCTEVSASVDDGPPVTKTTNLPTSAGTQYPAFQMITTNTSAKYLSIDFFAFRASVTR